MFIRKPASKMSLAMRKPLHGAGVNDAWYITQPKEGGCCPIYRKWHDMITRSYSEKFHKNNPTYKDCSVCENWLSFSDFLEWFELNCVDGWDLDKDLKVKGNKIYSPQTCLFVPSEINRLFADKNSPSKDLPNGVSIHSPTGKYRARTSFDGKRVYLGLFKSVDEAERAYLIEKDKEIKRNIEKHPQFKEVLGQYLCANINKTDNTNE